MNFTPEQYKLIFTAVRRYQERSVYDPKTYGECGEVLDELYPLVYTQKREQPT
jgi:hypothetical protein